MKTCRSCAFFKDDLAIDTITRWTKDDSHGFCYADKPAIRRAANYPACLAHREESNG